MLDKINWLLEGDFNLLRSPEDREKTGGDLSEMLLFNEAIGALGLVELPVQVRKFTWTNKQTNLTSSRKTELVLHICLLDSKSTKYTSLSYDDGDLIMCLASFQWTQIFLRVRCSGLKIT